MKTIGLVGFGAIGSYVLENFAHLGSAYKLSRVLAREPQLTNLRTVCGPKTFVTADADEFLSDLPEIIVEAAGHNFVVKHGAQILASGRDLYLLSIGALADADLAAQLKQAQNAGGGRLLLPPGALAGFDGLRALAFSGLKSVRYTSRKPPLAWQGTPAEAQFDLGALTDSTVVFEGSAREAARLFPKNANLAAAVALAGLGLDQTSVTLVAAPGIKGNTGEIDAEGTLGSLFVRVSGDADPANPKTSAIVGASVISALMNQASALQFI